MAQALTCAVARIDMAATTKPVFISSTASIHFLSQPSHFIVGKMFLLARSIFVKCYSIFKKRREGLERILSTVHSRNFCLPVYYLTRFEVRTLWSTLKLRMCSSRDDIGGAISRVRRWKQRLYIQWTLVAVTWREYQRQHRYSRQWLRCDTGHCFDVTVTLILVAVCSSRYFCSHCCNCVLKQWPRFMLVA